MIDIEGNVDIPSTITGNAIPQGKDGFSPIANVSKTDNVATITITDALGTTTTQVSDGINGNDGNDGYSPIANVVKVGDTATITITDKTGTTTASISDGTSGSSTWGNITGTLSNQTDLNNALNGKQESLVSGTNIKTINNESILGEGNISISGGSSVWGGITGTLADQTDLNTALGNKQDTLVSGTDIKTLNNTSLLGSGNISLNGITILTYGTSTWNDITTAYNRGDMLYIINGSRICPLAYLTSTSADFTYYRSIAKHTNTAQCDEIIIYNLTSTGTWTTKTRQVATFVEVGSNTGLTSTYTSIENGKSKITLNVNRATSITSTSTDAEIPTAKAVWDLFNSINNS